MSFMEIDIFFDKKRQRSVAVVRLPHDDDMKVSESVVADDNDSQSMGDMLKTIIDNHASELRFKRNFSFKSGTH